MCNNKHVNVAFQCDVKIAKEPFQASLSYQNQQMMLGASWYNEWHHQLSLQSFSKSIGVQLPSFLNWSITLQRIVLVYASKENFIQLLMQEESKATLLLSANLQKKLYCIRMQTNTSFYLSSLPFVGDFFDSKDGISLYMLQVAYSSKGIQVQYQCMLQLLGQSMKFGELPLNTPAQVISQDEDFSIQDRNAQSTMHWMELKKKIGPIYIRRIGYSFQDGKLSVSLDASFTLSILTCTFMELYVCLTLSNGFLFEYGIKGIAISLNKPPLYISGGLYVAKPGRLYNGEIQVQYEKFSFLALGSYGLTKQDKPSLFIYLVLKYPFGGPPCFFLSGIVAGFGLNRKLHLPNIDEVANFPLVQAAMGKHKTLTSTTTAEEALSTLSDVIEPMEGQHFVCAGVTFTSFGMVESIAVISVSFGTRLEIALLGLSEVTLPSKESEPIAYACLALRAVFSPDDGILQIEGALSKGSFLFAKDCQMHGGFAFYNWFKGEHKGDFVITIGGYHPAFHKKEHYPEVDRVRIFWNISSGLTLKAEAYFALTPNALMAGGHLELNYVCGKLKAWCYAIADFLIEWKPFHYDIAIGISIGASYRIDFLFIHTTFCIELSANLHIWGPEFSGFIHIKWFIISFTIHFNSGSSQLPNRITWSTFQNDFLPDFAKGNVSSNSIGYHLVRLQFDEGILAQKQGFLPYSTSPSTLTYMRASSFSLRIETAIPCSDITLYGNAILSSSTTIGIVPMGIQTIMTRLSIHVYKWIYKLQTYTKEEQVIQGHADIQNVPSAIWSTHRPDINDGMIKDVFMGYVMTSSKQWGATLPKQDWYSLQQLLKNEEYMCPTHFMWEEVTDVNDYVDESITIQEVMVASEKRCTWLQQLSYFNIRSEEEIQIMHFVTYADTLLNCPVIMHMTGNDLEEI